MLLHDEHCLDHCLKFLYWSGTSTNKKPSSYFTNKLSLYFKIAHRNWFQLKNNSEPNHQFEWESSALLSEWWNLDHPNYKISACTIFQPCYKE